MKHIVMLMVITVSLLCVQQLSTAQIPSCRNPAIRRGVEELKARPKLGVEYANVAELKLTSRKTNYQVGEILSLDLAILNGGKNPIFVHKLAGPTINVSARTDKGAEIAVIPSVIALEGVIPDSYALLQPDEIAVGSLQMLAGCNVEAFLGFTESREVLNRDVQTGKVRYGRGQFDRNLFVNWGDICLRTDHPGTFMITVTITNSQVVTSSCEPKVQTAVGEIRSAPLAITIIP